MTTIYVHDTFTRNTTGGNLGTADTGQAWSNQFGSIDANGTQAVVDAGSTGASLSYLDSGQSNCTAQVTLSTLYDQSGIVFRYTGGGTYWYVIATPTDPAGNNYQMSPQGVTLHMNNAGDTTVATYTSTIPKSGDVLAVTMNGNVYTVFLNGAQIISYTDSTNFNTTATKHGLFQNQHGNAGNPVPGTAFDDFYVADGLVTGGGSSPTPITASASFQGQGSLSASANIVNPATINATASFTGQGSLSATANLISPVVASASFQGQGSLTATGNNVWLGSASLIGQGSLSSNPVVVLTASSSFQGQGSLTAVVELQDTSVIGTANFYGSSSVVSNPIVTQAPIIVTVEFDGQGSLNGIASVIDMGVANFQGTSYLMANAVLPVSLQVPRNWNAVFDPKKSWIGVFEQTSHTWNAIFDPKKVWVGGE